MTHEPHLHMGDLGKAVGIPVINAVVLFASFVADMKEFLQILLILGTIIFTFMQILHLARRLGREKSLFDLVIAAQKLCNKAQAGECPVEKKMLELEKQK